VQQQKFVETKIIFFGPHQKLPKCIFQVTQYAAAAAEAAVVGGVLSAL